MMGKARLATTPAAALAVIGLDPDQTRRNIIISRLSTGEGHS